MKPDQERITDAEFEVIRGPDPSPPEPSTWDEFWSWNIWGKLGFLAMWAIGLAIIYWVVTVI